MQRTISGSFRLRLMALVMLGVLPPLWGAIWVASYRATNIFRIEAQASMAARVDVLSQQVDQWHEKNSLALDELRSEAAFDSMERSQQLPNVLSTLQSNKTEVESVATLDLDGDIVAKAGTQPSSPTNYRHQPWFQSAAAGAEHSRVVRSPSKSDPTVIFSKPILAQPKLAVGDHSPKVAQLQRRLKNLEYYSGPIDGIYAGETVKAIARFKQAYHQEDASGDQVDPLTWQSIDVAGDVASDVARSAEPVQRFAPSLSSSEENAAEDVEGVVMIEAQLSDIKQAIDSVQSGDHGYAFLLDENGHILVQSEPAQSGSAQSGSAQSDSAQSDSDPVLSQISRRQQQHPSISLSQRQRPKKRPNQQPNIQLKQGSELASPASVHRAFLQASQAQNEGQQVSPIATAAQNNAAVLPNLSSVFSWRLPTVLSVPTLFSDAASSQSQTALGFWDHRGDRWIAHSQALANGWQIVLAQPNDSFSREVSLFRHLSIVTGAIALLITAIAMSVLSARLTQPILSLSHAANAISLGHLDQKVTVKNKDEIGTLANAFNSVAAQLQQSFAQLAEQNEALKRSDQLKDQFLANTSHELKTPLNGVIGIAESLLEGAAGPLNEAQRHNVSMIAASSHRLTRLVNDILDFSKLQHQQMPLHRKPLGVFASVNVVLALSQTLIGAKSLTLENKISADCPLVWADENRVQQILLNLVSNAIKFTHEGTICFSAELVEDGQFVAVSVQDEGIGIAKASLNDIFQPFQQVEQAARSYGGTGLGLSIVQHLVKLHGGRLWAHSVLGEGSTFTFTLPIAQKFEPSKSQPKSQPKLPLKIDRKTDGKVGKRVPIVTRATTPSNATDNVAITSGAMTSDAMTSDELSQLKSLRKRTKLAATISKALARKQSPAKSDALSPHKFNILVVDDEPINVQVLRNHLSLANYTVTHAFNGAEAIALLKQQQQQANQFDLVVLDVMMPRMSGYEVCQKIREMSPAHELPVVMLTAKNQVSDLITGFHFGANDYMTKPFSKDELLTRIKSHLRLSKTNHAYGRFVPSEYLRFLNKESIVDVRLGDHVSKEMAVMFSDIRSFTSLSESMTPQENFDFVNAYLRQVSPAIRAQNGFIVKYLGDGMMAVFPAGVEDAIAAGIAKLKSVAQYNQRRSAKGFKPIAVGIGIHFGHMMVGMVGESARMQGDAFSDNVNLTARLESLTKRYGVSMVISAQALSQVSSVVMNSAVVNSAVVNSAVVNSADADQANCYQTRFLDRVIVKGRSEPIDIYQIINGESETTKQQIAQTTELFERGVSCYHSGEFVVAKNCFEEILQQVPTDKTAQIYCDRLTHLIASPPEYWDGVWRLTEK